MRIYYIGHVEGSRVQEIVEIEMKAIEHGSVGERLAFAIEATVNETDINKRRETFIRILKQHRSTEKLIRYLPDNYSFSDKDLAENLAFTFTLNEVDMRSTVKLMLAEEKVVVADNAAAVVRYTPPKQITLSSQVRKLKNFIAEQYHAYERDLLSRETKLARAVSPLVFVSSAGLNLPVRNNVIPNYGRDLFAKMSANQNKIAKLIRHMVALSFIGIGNLFSNIHMEYPKKYLRPRFSDFVSESPKLIVVSSYGSMLKNFIQKQVQNYETNLLYQQTRLAVVPTTNDDSMRDDECDLLAEMISRRDKQATLAWFHGFLLAVQLFTMLEIYTRDQHQYDGRNAVMDLVSMEMIVLLFEDNVRVSFGQGIQGLRDARELRSASPVFNFNSLLLIMMGFVMLADLPGRNPLEALSAVRSSALFGMEIVVVRSIASDMFRLARNQANALRAFAMSYTLVEHLKEIVAYSIGFGAALSNAGTAHFASADAIDSVSSMFDFSYAAAVIPATVQAARDTLTGVQTTMQAYRERVSGYCEEKEESSVSNASNEAVEPDGLPAPSLGFKVAARLLGVYSALNNMRGTQVPSAGRSTEVETLSDDADIGALLNDDVKMGSSLR